MSCSNADESSVAHAAAAASALSDPVGSTAGSAGSHSSPAPSGMRSFETANIIISATLRLSACSAPFFVAQTVPSALTAMVRHPSCSSERMSHVRTFCAAGEDVSSSTVRVFAAKRTASTTPVTTSARRRRKQSSSAPVLCTSFSAHCTRRCRSPESATTFPALPDSSARTQRRTVSAMSPRTVGSGPRFTSLTKMEAALCLRNTSTASAESSVASVISRAPSKACSVLRPSWLSSSRDRGSLRFISSKRRSNMLAYSAPSPSGTRLRSPESGTLCHAELRLFNVFFAAAVPELVPDILVTHCSSAPSAPSLG
mmetsp:Transcript_28420/g.92816  ORF Transcript_28420/g.92816 Transcript_28420/m.92816 type:complete len:313 (-) Transcript_28420:193-1131(-)